MAVNRFYVECRICKELMYMGKSCGQGIHNVNDSVTLESVYEWMWEHLLNCHKDESTQGELFIIHGEGIMNNKKPGELKNKGGK